ncbi:MAG TPA: ATPase domain-containing protein, partial [Armatimonadota bacterium]|nr:ATPase domain-containing protein [Armatimonadota bacterium]
RPGRRPLGFLTSRAMAVIEELQPQRLVVDAVSTLAKSPIEEGRNRGELATMLSCIRTTPATTLVMDETPGIVSEFEVTGGVMISSLVDNIIVLRYVELSSEMRRAASVLKARYVDHDKEIREYVIGQGGLALQDKFQVETGLFKGMPRQSSVEDFF